MKNDREVMEALLAGETLIDMDGAIINLDEKGMLIGFYPDYWEFEIKTKTIKINGFDVPEPLREALNEGDFYYVTETNIEIKHKIEWEEDDRDFEWLSLGICHKTKEAAELHRKALLSFTEVKK